MAAAAKLTGDIAHRDDTHDVAVFLIEQRGRIALLRLFDRQLFLDDRISLRDVMVDQRLDLHQLLFADLLKVRKVKAQIFRAVI